MSSSPSEAAALGGDKLEGIGERPYTGPYTDEQVMLALSFISYLGFHETAVGRAASQRIFDSIDRALADLAPGLGKWRIVWGPAQYRVPLTTFDQNLMFVVQSQSSPADYAIVIRGTNPVSLTNWLLEDFAVLMQVDWPYSRPSQLEPKISKSTAIGLQALQHLVPAAGLPGAGSNLYQFLAHEVSNQREPHLTLSVTGHSLGGALAPSVALWLADTQQSSDDPKSPPWDAGKKVSLRVFAYAGPSPGNADFARHYDQVLGAATKRLWNDFDVVPHGWALTSLRRLPELYGPLVPDLLMRLVLWSTTLLAHRGNYVHVASEAPAAVGGKRSGVLKDYVHEMLYQHTLAYAELWKLNHHFDLRSHLAFDDEVNLAFQELGHHKRSVADKPLPVERSSRQGLHRLYRVPATLVRALLPEAVALFRLRRRVSCFEKRKAS